MPPVRRQNYIFLLTSPNISAIICRTHYKKARRIHPNTSCQPSMRVIIISVRSEPTVGGRRESQLQSDRMEYKHLQCEIALVDCKSTCSMRTDCPPKRGSEPILFPFLSIAFRAVCQPHALCIAPIHLFHLLRPPQTGTVHIRMIAFARL